MLISVIPCISTAYSSSVASTVFLTPVKADSKSIAAFAVAVAVTMGTICSKSAVKASNDNMDNDFISYKITIPSDYYASTDKSSTSLFISTPTISII